MDDGRLPRAILNSKVEGKKLESAIACVKSAVSDLDISFQDQETSSMDCKRWREFMNSSYTFGQFI